MRGSWVALIVAAAALAGCAGGEPANPNLAAPKLVMQTLTGGEAVIFVHAAFGERMYDWIVLLIDNETLTNRTAAFSLEETVPTGSFFFEAEAGTPRERYALRGHAMVDPVDERVRVAFVNEDGAWSDAQNFGLPFERVMTRRDTA